ncbi:DNA mismatch repair endonuclease MutL [uncultured Victivallis sp.]|uniref:DNA mismatch repair endonuclease MutL n=1 Tax=uncultured Victivallis sp. TaxID=354118 RepID=UPI0025EB891D|nr:DNA mismatch repair endonuclease MutL [uncultured Victivallis sp.]
MSRIKIMSEHLSNRIAAGEVIERPASVVKELVENAIDAGARRIRIEIERAGSRLISVTDDGCGMDSDDALLCIEPHGTSKLLSEQDIDNIVTLGFRGEALPSIASISRFELTTRTAEQLEGTRVVVEGGRLIEAAPCGGAVGTTIRIRDLFFNTPARRKFLKADATEAHHIEEAVLALAIPRPEVAFELVMDGRCSFRSPASEKPEPRLREFFGRVYADALWPVSHQESGIRVTGYIASPGFTRNSRREQRTFVNGRAVESPAIFRGIREGYATLAESGRFPPVILFLEMSPQEVDVNVHPAKREVRFKREYAVGRAVAAAVGNALRRTREAQPAPRTDEKSLPLSGQVPLKLVLDAASVRYEPGNSEQPSLPTFREERPRIAPEPASEPESTPEQKPEQKPECPPTPPPEQAAPKTTTDSSASFLTDTPAVEIPVRSKFDYPDIPFNGEWPTRIIGVLDDTYLLAAGKSGLILIDQHAAHERVMFERLLDSARRGVAAQTLLLPQTLELPHSMAALLLRNRKIFEAIGFDVEPLGSNTVMLNSVPAALPEHRDLTSMIPDMLQELIENAEHKLPVELEYVARAACRAAVKAHDVLPLPAAEELLRQLGECRQGTLCPHGRPTMITITLREIEKRFSRR